MTLRHHKDLTSDRWQQFSLVEQLANIGSEVFRSLSWRDKDKKIAWLAFERSLELFDLTLASHQKYPTLKEVARAREAWVDYFFGDNEYHTSAIQWQNYFYQFTYLAKNEH